VRPDLGEPHMGYRVIAAAIVFGACLPLTSEAGFFHTLEGTPRDSLIAGRQDWLSHHLVLDGGDLLLASTFAGNHTDVRCGGRSFANLTLLDPVGRTRWSRSYETLPADRVMALAGENGFVMVAQRRRCHQEAGRAPDLEVHRVTRQGRLIGPAERLAGTRLVDWLATGTGATLVTSRQNSLQLHQVDRRGGLQHLTNLAANARVRSIASAGNALWLLLHESGDEMSLLELAADGGDMKRHPLDHPATHLAGGPAGNMLYLIDSPRRGHPKLQVWRLGSAAPVYRGVHSLTVTGATVAPDGTLWLVGSNDDQAAFLTIRDGRITANRVFVSGLPRAGLTQVSPAPDRIILSGTTYVPGRFTTQDADVFAVSYDPRDDAHAVELDQWAACTMDTDRYTRAAAALARRLRVFTRLSAPAAHRRIPWIDYLHGQPAASPDCTLKGMTGAIRLLEALAGRGPDVDWSDEDKFQIDLGFSENLQQLWLKAPDSRTVRRPVEPGLADWIRAYLEQEVYRHLPDYRAARRGLRRESAIHFVLADAPAPSFAAATELYRRAHRDWTALTLERQQRLQADVDRYQVKLVEDGPVRIRVHEYGVSIELPWSRRTELIAILAQRALPALEEIPVLEGDIWAATGLRPASAPEVDDRAYLEALRTLRDDSATLQTVRRKLAGSHAELVIVAPRQERASKAADTLKPDGDPGFEPAGRFEVPIDRLDRLATALRALPDAPPADVHAVSPDQLLGLSIRYGWTHQLTTALDRGADASADCFAGRPAVHAAAERGRTAMTLALIRAGAPIDLVDPNLHTPLHLALQRRRIRTAAALLEAGADPNLLTNGNETALDIAQRRSAPSWLVQWIRDYGGRAGPGHEPAGTRLLAVDCGVATRAPAVLIDWP